MKWLILKSGMGVPEMQDENTGAEKSIQTVGKKKEDGRKNDASSFIISPPTLRKARRNEA